MKALGWSIFCSLVLLANARGLDNPTRTSSAGASPGSSLNALSQSQLAQGLMEALDKGIHQAIAQLGHDGGFLTNVQVRIPMPQQMATVEKTLRSFG
jgi:hypothetical protein